MPRYLVTTYTISEWTAEFEADSEQEARDAAYDEVACDIPLDGHVEFRSILLRE